MSGIPEDQLTPLQRAIINSVRVRPVRLTRSGLAKMLTGSKARGMDKVQGHPYYGRLRRYGRKDITHEIDSAAAGRLPGGE